MSGMKQPPASEEAKQAFDGLEMAFASQYEEISRKNVFGFDGLHTNGKYFVSLYGDGVILKLPTDSREEALKLKGAEYFTPIGKSPSEWIMIPLTHLDAWEKYANLSREYVERLRKGGKKE